LLASDGAGFVTGQMLSVSGGLTMALSTPGFSRAQLQELMPSR
jgi:hypothetical protein